MNNDHYGPGDPILWTDEEPPDDYGYPTDPVPIAAAAREHFTAPEVIVEKALAEGATVAPTANLPDEFWAARPVLKTIREAAHAVPASPDAVLGVVLARTAAMLHNQVKFDSTGGDPTGSLNLFVALVGASGAGKSRAEGAAARLILPPSYLEHPGAFRDGIGLGTGEGIAEAYMGFEERETGTQDRQGHPKVEKVRAQVRHNVFFTVDEGQTLTKMMLERAGTTIGPALRSAWVGKALGQANAREDTTRFLPAGAYNMGLAIGYQPAVAQDLLADGGPGTPQRFLWLSASDPNAPRQQMPPVDPFRLPLCDGYGRVSDVLSVARCIITFPPAISAQLRDDAVARLRGDLIVDELDSQTPLMLCKLAALFAVMDGRSQVTEEDWELGCTMWATSCAVRDRLIEFGRQKEALKREAQKARHTEDAAAKRSGVHATDARHERVIAWIARKVAEIGPIRTPDLYRKLKATDRDIYETCLRLTEARGSVTVDDEGMISAPN